VLGVVFDYEHRPLVIETFCADGTDYFNCTVVDEREPVVASIFAVHVHGAYTLFERLQLGLVVPIAASSGEALPIEYDDDAGETHFDSHIRGGWATGLADPRVQARYHVLGGRTEQIGVAAAAYGTIPLGQATASDRWIGDSGPAFGLRGIGELYATPELRGALNLGVEYRPPAEMVGIDVGPTMTYGVAGAYHITSIFEIAAEISGRTAFGAHVDQMEGNASARLELFGGLSAMAGGGVGLILGPGVPNFRLIAGATWAPRLPPDSDGDGTIDENDACPDVVEDVDGYEDDNGCPEDDNDGDVIADGDDRCPDEAEDIDEHEDADGCPEDDNDGDGVRDGYDSCPATPEDLDGDRDTDGCPDLDTDHDNIEDSADRCPNEPEDTDGLADEDGCPEVDADNDGIPDDRDECADVAEDLNHRQDQDGCPETPPPPAATAPPQVDDDE
jgi:hypothetical protein